jgi:NADPH:quinone reductase-like Zn-dependent oxidoreductase
MKAVVFNEFGSSEVLELTDLEEPHAGSGQVRIKTMAAGVNMVDSHVRNGLMQGAFAAQFPAIPGIEAAGVVDEVGEGVTEFAVGDEVFGHVVAGAYAQYALLEHVSAKPAGVSWEVAASLPVAVETSDRVLETLNLTAGQTLLVHGASGVTGSVGGQMAAARGVRVIGTASEHNHEFLRSVGIIPVLYGEGLTERVRELAPSGVDAVWDAVGHDVLEESVELVGGAKERVVTIADPRAYELGITFSTGPRPGFDAALSNYARLFELGRLAVRIDHTVTLEEAATAQDLVADGHARGKIVLLPWAE